MAEGREVEGGQNPGLALSDMVTSEMPNNPRDPQWTENSMAWLQERTTSTVLGALRPVIGHG